MLTPSASEHLFRDRRVPTRARYVDVDRTNKVSLFNSGLTVAHSGVGVIDWQFFYDYDVGRLDE